jgi:hypothetical protein
MRSTLALSLFLVGTVACSTEEPVDHSTDPVDGPYTVALTKLHETCYDVADGVRAETPFTDEDFEDETVEVDVFLRPDGLVDLRHRSDKLPGYIDGGVIERIDRLAGRDLRSVDQVRSVQSQYSTTGMVAKGRIAPDALSLDLTETYVDDHNDCTYTVHAEGTRRPVADPAALDGYYDVTTKFIGDACNSPMTEAMDSETRPVRLSVARMPDDTLVVDLNGSVRFSMPVPPSNGTDKIGVAHTAGLHILQRNPFGGAMFVAVTGSVGGSISPTLDGVHLLYHVPPVGPDDCDIVVSIDGLRFVPDASATENDYRMQFDVDGPCLSGARTELGTASLRAQKDGTYILADIGGITDGIVVADGAFERQLGDFDLDGFSIVVAGTIDPPNLDYAVDVKQLDPHGVSGLCEYTVRASGVARYVF